jgi:hypothetical protein
MRMDRVRRETLAERGTTTEEVLRGRAMARSMLGERSMI